VTETHAMIYIETLGVGNNAPLFEIGVQLFNPMEDSLGDTMFLPVDIMDVMLKTGRCPQPEILQWWREQEYDPLGVGGVRIHLMPALHQLKMFFKSHEIDKVWANSPSFDLVIIEGHYKDMQMSPPPWTYKQELDYRTIRWRAELLGYQAPDTPPNHNALDYARLQAETLMEMLKL